MAKEINMIKRQEQDLREKDFAVEDNVQKKRRPRKTIGEEGSRKQTLIGLITTLILGLIFYLPNEIKQKWPEGVSNWQTEEEVFRIEKPKTTHKTLEEAIGFKVEIKTKEASQIAVEQILETQAGEYAVYVESLVTGGNFGINEDKAMTAASVIKFPILAVYYQAVDKKQIDPQTIYVLINKDRLVYGTGSLQGQPAGKEFSYQEIADLVGKESDNMGAQLLIGFLGGEKEVEKVLRNWGLTQTSVINNKVTAKEMALLWKKIYKNNLLTNDSKAKLLTSLTDTLVETRIPEGVPDGIKVRHKYGSEIGVVNDCGVVEAKSPYIICILGNEVNDGQAERLLPKISRAVWEWLGK